MCQGLRLGAAVLALGLVSLPVGTAAQTKAKAKAKDAAAEASAKPDTAAIQRAYAAGLKAYESGDMAGCEQQLSIALAGGGLPNAQMARALYLRGSASRKLGRPAQAISDLTTAVWLKGGLSESEKTKVAEERQLAYREAGLGDTPPPIGGAPLDQAPKTAASAPPPASGAQVVQVTEQSFWSNFSLPSLTGSSSQQAKAPAQGATTQTAESGQSGFWSFLSSGSSPQPAPTDQAAASPAAPPAAPAGTQDAATVAAAPQATAPPAEASHSAWETQTAANDAHAAPVAEAPAATQLVAGYAPTPAPDAGLNPMSTSSAPATSSNPLSGAGTAVGNFFSGMFSSGTNETQTAQAATTPVTTGSTEHTPHWGGDTTVVTAQTSSMVQRGPDSPPASAAPAHAHELPWGATASPSPPGAAPVAVASTGAAGKYKLQVAAVRSREEAERLAQTLHGYQPVRDGTVSPEIDEAVIGSMGTFYRVRLGPYADAKEPGQLCKTLRPQGFDCLVVTQ